MDFGKVFPKLFLSVVTNECNRFPFVEIINSISAHPVILKLDSIFILRGIPEVIKLDNGPPFNAENFLQYAMSMGFKHRKIIPLWPKVDSEAEHFMRTVKKVVKAGIPQNISLEQELRTFLLAYCDTPHSIVKVALATFFQYPNQIKAPRNKWLP